MSFYKIIFIIKFKQYDAFLYFSDIRDQYSYFYGFTLTFSVLVNLGYNF